MPSDSIAGFLDEAQASRVLFPEQVEQLIRQPDIPRSDLTALCAYLLERGVLTRFQADAIREGRARELNFAGYPVLDELGPCPGGTAYRALHPSLRTPLVLRRYRADGFGPADNAAAVVGRARAVGTIQHPHILPLLDAGVYEDQAYSVLDHPADAADLDTLLSEIGGAMPGFLAAEYGRALASALRAVHERGGWHGEVRPGLLFVGPLTTKQNPDGTARRRPAPNATVKLAETGLTPVRPPGAEHLPPPEVLPYLPPERVAGNAPDARGDIYGLGATLYLLLTGRPPFVAETPRELLEKIRAAEPADLVALRPADAGLAAVVMTMLARKPEDRPATAYDVEVALAPFCRPGTVPAAPLPQSVGKEATSSVPRAVPLAEAAPLSTGLGGTGGSASQPGYAEPVAAEEAEPDGWGVGPNAFAEAQAASAAEAPKPRRRAMTAQDKSRTKLWIAVGALLHLTAVGLLVAWALGAFTPPPDPDPEPKSEKKTDAKPDKKGGKKTKRDED
jgi:serine/threonine protein kinase